MSLVAEGRFRKRLVPSTRKYGQYRGAGSVEVLDGRLRVGVRLAVGSILAGGLPLLSGGKFGIGLLLIYPIVEYWWLKPETTEIPFSKITGVGTDEEENIVAITFEGDPWTNPVVLESADWQQLSEALKAQVDRTTPDQPTLDLALNSPARSGLRLAVLSILVAVPILQSSMAGFGLWDSVKGLQRARSLNGRGRGLAKAGIVIAFVGLAESVAVLWLYAAAFFATAK